MNLNLCWPFAALAFALPLVNSAAPQENGELPQSSTTRELYLANCATCHGVEGDGEGVADLDRKARSFKAGGFSYGNTPDAVTRTITSGIPGTPMPAFGEAFTKDQIDALAMYVIELGPGLPPPPKNSELVVKDRPLIVRGMLPPIAEGAVSHPRGLMIGRPSGFTFEYRTDDVRLLGVRQGGFVDRTDWVGRGGTGLLPLGTVVALCEDGNPGPTFSLQTEHGAEPLTARFKASDIVEGLATLTYDLVSTSQEVKASVTELVGSKVLTVGWAYRQYWWIHTKDDVARVLVTRLLADDLVAVPMEHENLHLKRRDLPTGDADYFAWTVTNAVLKRRGIAPLEDGIELRPTPITELLTVRVSKTKRDELGEDEIVRLLREEF